MTDDRLSRLRKAATRPRRTVPILLDGDVRGQIEAVEDELDRLYAQRDDAEKDAATDRRLASKAPKVDPQIATLEAELASLREQAVENTLYLVLEGMQRTPYRALVAEHPPRKDEDGKVLLADLIGANTDTLPVPLIRACIVGYKATGDVADTEVRPLPVSHPTDVCVDWLLGWHRADPETGAVEAVDPFLSDRQIETLWQAAFAINRGDDAVPLPRKRSTTTRSAGE